jgi:hypothetical protein
MASKLFFLENGDRGGIPCANAKYVKYVNAVNKFRSKEDFIL